MKAAKTIPFIAGVASLYTFLIFLSAGLTGAGHGSGFFVVALLVPASIFGGGVWTLWAGVAFWTAVAILVAMRRLVWCRLLAGTLLLSHYMGVLFMSMQQDAWGDLGHVWRVAWATVSLIVGAYLLSQGFLWNLITRKQTDA